MDDIRRGEIFYIARGGATNGSEQFADRPAVVVSNDENNKHSGVIEVVYMTTQPKTDLPTHVTVRSTGRLSTVLCEQVSSVSTERVNNYIGQVSEQEMKNIDIALMISLQLDNGGKPSKQYNETIQRQQEEIDSLKREIETLFRSSRNVMTESQKLNRMQQCMSRRTGKLMQADNQRTSSRFRPSVTHSRHYMSSYLRGC
nr:MAG TPA: PemK-like protein [Caudoviricetes sp.]